MAEVLRATHQSTLKICVQLFRGSQHLPGNGGPCMSAKQTTPGAGGRSGPPPSWWHADWAGSKRRGFRHVWRDDLKPLAGVSKPSMLFNPSLHLGCRRLNRTTQKNKLGRVLHPTLSSGGMSQPSARYAEGASSWVKKKRGTRQDQASPLTKGVV